MLLWLCDIQSVLQDLDSGYFFIVLTALLVYAEMNKVLINRCPCWCIQWSLWAMWWGPPTTVTCYRTEIYVTVWILLCANKVIFKQWILLCANKVWKRGKSLFHTRHLLLDLSLDLYCPQPSRKKRKENGTELILYILQSLQKDTGVQSRIAKLLKGIQCTRAPVDQQLAKKFRELFYILPDQTTTSGIPHARTLLMTRVIMSTLMS